MGYYDFDHFWSPEEVCAQKTVSASTINVLTECRNFINKFLGKRPAELHVEITRGKNQDLAKQSHSEDNQQNFKL